MLTEQDWAKVENFKKPEFKHPEILKPESVFILDIQRKRLGYPILVTSDGRPGIENVLAGGVSDSLHPRGEAFDTKCLKITPLDYFLKCCELPWTEIGLYEIGIVHLGFSLNPERKIKRFFGFECPNKNCALDHKDCGHCKGIRKIYKPISAEILRWYLTDASQEGKKMLLGIA